MASTIMTTTTTILFVWYGNDNKRSTNFDEMPHLRGIFVGGGKLMWHSSASAPDKQTGAVACVRAVEPILAVAF